MSALLFACAVCGAGEDDRASGALLVMTIIISLLPLGMLGGGIGYLVYKTKRAEQSLDTGK